MKFILGNTILDDNNDLPILDRIKCIEAILDIKSVAKFLVMVADTVNIKMFSRI